MALVGISARFMYCTCCTDQFAIDHCHVGYCAVPPPSD